MAGTAQEIDQNSTWAPPTRSLRARRLAPARRVRTRSTRSRSSTLVLIVHLGQLSPLKAPAGGLGILGPPLDGGSDEPSAARCAGVCRLRGRSARQRSARSLTEAVTQSPAVGHADRWKPRSPPTSLRPTESESNSWPIVSRWRHAESRARCRKIPTYDATNASPLSAQER